MLHHLHSMHPRLLYLDLKPENIIIEPGPRLRLLDFGSVRVQGDEQHMDKNYSVFGTRGFSAPELFSGEKSNWGCECDTYSLGILLYYLLTGNDPDKPPYKVRDVREYDPSLPMQLSKVIIKAASADRAERFSSVTDLLSAITEACKKKAFWQKRVKHPLRITKNVWKTEKLYPGLYVLFILLLVLSVNVYKQKAYAQKAYAPNEYIKNENALSDHAENEDAVNDHTQIIYAGEKIMSEIAEPEKNGEIHMQISNNGTTKAQNIAEKESGSIKGGERKVLIRTMEKDRKTP